MYSIWFLLLLMINIINTTNLRCNEDINESIQLIENCRACVIFIDKKISTTILSRQIFIHNESSIQENHRYRRNTNIIVHQKCAREIDGPLYGYNQTHCYCNSNECNSNIQRCIYEIASKRYFSCYHGSNSSYFLPEIYKKCRSCRIRMESDSIYHYECLTFGEQEQNNHTSCTCQHPMCNQDFSICQRFQQISSRSQVHSTSTIMTTKNVSMIINATLVSNTNHIKQQILMKNSTLIELSSQSSNDTKENQPVINELKNHANFYYNSNIFFFILFIICDH